jgi:hypothetical protein
MIEEKTGALASEMPRCRLEHVPVDLASPQARSEFLDGALLAGAVTGGDTVRHELPEWGSRS